MPCFRPLFPLSSVIFTANKQQTGWRYVELKYIYRECNGCKIYGQTSGATLVKVMPVERHKKIQRNDLPMQLD